MLFTCYNFHSNRITNTVIFVKEKDIINVYVNLNNNYNNLEGGPLLVITEENMKKYPILYKIYIISIFLTYDTSKLVEIDNGYCIKKLTIWKNIYINDNYDCEDTYMSNYPTMSYNISTNEHIKNSMYYIEKVVMIEPELISDLIEKEIYYIDEELEFYEEYTKTQMMYSSYFKKILPDNIPEDLANSIFTELCYF